MKKEKEINKQTSENHEHFFKNDETSEYIISCGEKVYKQFSEILEEEFRKQFEIVIMKENHSLPSCGERYEREND